MKSNSMFSLELLRLRTVRELVCLFVTFLACLAGVDAIAGFSCTGILSEPQREGFSRMFSPPYSPKLFHVGGAVTEANMSKQLSQDRLKTLQAAAPTVVARYTLSDDRAILLKGWMNDNASATLPGWIATATTVVVPQAWVGLSADIFTQVINGAGDTGRLKVANLAGTVSKGGLVAIAEQVTKDSSGKLKFLWTYVYQANLNGQTITSPLTSCSADVITH